LSSLSITFLGSNIDRFWESRKLLGAGLQVRDSIISHGCFLRSCSVEHSIVGIRSRIEDGSTLKVCNVYRVKCLQSSSLGVLDCLYQSCIVHKHIQ
jgi:ADP-glucose pyrophosphorylase